MSLEIRVPQSSDAGELASLHVSTWKEAYAHLLPNDFFSDQYIQGRRAMWDHVLNNPRDDISVCIAERDNSIIGFAWCGPGIGVGDDAPPRSRQLYAIYVKEAHHGTGVGQALLDEVLGSRPAMLWVAKENPRAVAFYERNRFRFDGIEQIDPHAPMITDARMIR